MSKAHCSLLTWTRKCLNKYSPLHTMSNPPPYCPAALVVVEIWRVVVVVLHAAGLRRLPRFPSCLLPRFPSQLTLGRPGHCSKSPRISLKLSYVDMSAIITGRTYFNEHMSRSAVPIGKPLVSRGTRVSQSPGDYVLH
jgi:hypothetical protein